MRQRIFNHAASFLQAILHHKAVPGDLLCRNFDIDAVKRTVFVAVYSSVYLRIHQAPPLAINNQEPPISTLCDPNLTGEL